MATLSSQTPATPANAPITAAGVARPPSTGTTSLSDPPPVPGPSPSVSNVVTIASANGAANAPPNPSPVGPPFDGSPGADMMVYPRDGRVRNPVPSKLKNVNEHLKGNFGVMHMDVVSHNSSEGRDTAAKRTSESTALQARLAQTDAYVSHQRRANYPRPVGLKQFSSPKPSTSAEPAGEPGPPQPLTAAETKAEQARLLTLLRTLSPQIVVDQICRGLAYFGGVPDAPPPAEDKFPVSAEANGSGSVFVGWIAEIFPDQEHPRPRLVEDSPAQPGSQKRPRGRPKGSKATKSRSDKGLKKGSQKTSKEADGQAQDHQDDSWVDVEDSVLELNDNGDLVEAIEALRNGPSTPTGLATATPGTSSAAGFRSINDSAPNSSTKKRGRPKGSKNRPKDKATLPSVPPPKVTPVPVPVPMLDIQPKSTANAPKPKNINSRPRPFGDASNDTDITNIPAPQQQQRADLTVAADPSPSVQAPAPAPSFADNFTTPAANGTTSHHPESQPSALTTTSTLPSPATSHVKASTVTANKRKRPTANTAAQAESIGPLGGAPPSSQHLQPNNMQVVPPALPPTQPSQPAPQPSTVNTVPPTKRARKSQDSNSPATARRPTPNNITQKASNLPSSLKAENTSRPNSGDSVAQSHPPAEGLEAHFAAMQSHNTDQMQIYGNSRSQHKQQHHSSNSMGATASPVPTAAAASAGGLDSHFEHFTTFQSLGDNSRQSTTTLRQQQQPTQTASPIPSQPSKLPQMSAAVTSQQQPRAAQNYYSQSQGLGASPYNAQQPSYATTQRPQQHLSSASPTAGLVQHVTNSPQFGAQSNSSLMQTDNNYRGSPSLIHNNAAFAPRRIPNLDSPTYRSSSNPNHAVANHSPHFSARQASTSTTAHNGSHTLPSGYNTFSDSHLFDMGLDSNGNHGNIGIGGDPYINSGAVPQQQQQQRSSSSNTASVYTSSGMNNTYLSSTNMGRTGQQQNRWPS
ncbi:hypothetical protein F4808DRAFT_119289 [Astrocystis sublimbata]|nr:hypothetical protein F4808DRAFT_119289 [Astrocystis sublimbata]